MQTVTLRIEELAYRGAGVGRAPDGRVVFVPGTAPGERVTVQLARVRKKYAEGVLLGIGEAAPGRIQPACPHYGACPGCCYQHVRYADELAAKSAQLAGFLRRLPGLDKETMAPPVAAPEPLGYRNKITLHVGRDSGGRAVTGYIGHDNRELVAVEACPLATPAINHSLGEWLAGARAERQRPLPQRLILRQTAGEPVHGWENEAPAMRLVEQTPLGPLQTPAAGFFQVNPSVAESLIKEVRVLIERSAPGSVLDLYCGCGIFALAAAASGVKDVTGIDNDRAAIACARDNAATLGLSGLRFMSAMAEDAVHEWRAKTSPDGQMWIVDPPRRGLPRKLIDHAAAIRPASLLYISCAPDTLARDLSILSEAGYRADHVRLLDMFPRTYGFETVVLLRKEGP